MSSSRTLLFSYALSLGVVAALPAQYQASYDPPSRVGRLSFIVGAVSLYPSGATDWTAGSINYPLTSDDGVWSDAGARAEIQLGSSTVRLGPQTSLALGEVNDSVTQFRIDQGSIDIQVRNLEQNEVYEVDTPSGIVTIYDRGHYRIDVTPDGRRTTVTVRDGDAQVTLGDRDYNVRPGESATMLGAGRAPSVGAAIPVDEWERWADDRDRREGGAQSARYVSRDMVGYEDLDAYGNWSVDAAYGPTWTPSNVPSGWAPYRNGHWESVQPWGWTWIDDAPWGFAPFHYGRWVSVRGRWSWIPGSARTRPVYAPALVAFVGGASWSLSLSLGGGGAVGWVPLGPGEVYVPSYRASSTYVRNVNVTNVNVTRIDFNRLDVNRMTYANRNVPGAVTAVPRDAFERSRPIARAAVAVRPADVSTARPSAVPTVGDRPIDAPPRGDRTRDRAPGGRDANVAHPPATANALPVPPAPPQSRGRPRHPQDQQRPPVGQAQPPAAPPPQTTLPPDRGRGRGRQEPPPVTPPVNPPGPPTTIPQPPPRVMPPPPPPPVTPPPDRGRGRGRQDPPPPPPPAPTPQPPPTVIPPPPPPPPVTPPPDRGRGRGRQDPPPPPPPAPIPPPPPKVIPPPPPQPAPPPRVIPPPPPPQPAPPPPDRGRGRGDPRSRPGGGGPDAPDPAILQQQRKQLSIRQAQETADLNRRHDAQLKALPPGIAQDQMRKQQQDEKKALADKQQRERAALEPPRPASP